jgi:quinoprotein dehydrogenase-associated probable ABC transporter substrate-binding protein
VRAWTAKLAVCLSIFGVAQAQAQTADLVAKTAFRVCADPANMPFSNKAGEGFENKIAELFAEKLELPLRYEWFPQAIGFIRKTLGEKRCDVVIGYAQGHELVLNTNHYYVSSYVFVTEPDSPLADVTSLADERLKDKRLGVMAGAPPATHMARHGLIGKAKGYRLMVDRRVDSPADEMIADLKSGEIDAAVLWGPIGGSLGKSNDPPLVVTPLLNEVGAPRMFYRITMGVRQGDLVWKRKLNSMIRRNQEEIDAILSEYGLPLLTEMGDGVVEKTAE